MKPSDLFPLKGSAVAANFPESYFQGKTVSYTSSMTFSKLYVYGKGVYTDGSMYSHGNE